VSATVSSYEASCHCGAVQFRFRSAPIVAGRRCNCSICVRKGIVMSVAYYPPDAFDELVGLDATGDYRFGDRDVSHRFCRTCGVHPFNVVASVPPSYDGPAKPGDFRINLGCVHGLDVLSLPIEIIDGRSF
jgi:hypothetical protein